MWKLPRFEDAGQLQQVIVNGIRIDLSYLALMLLPVILLFILVNWFPRIQPICMRVARYWLFLVITIAVFLELATPLFISEFDIRPNRLFIEYLNSPVEIAGMLTKGFLLESIVIISATLIAGYYLIIPARHTPRLPVTNPIQKGGIGVILLLLLVTDVVVARSGFQHRPINPAMVTVGSDRLVNSLVLNSSYSVLYATYQLLGDSGRAFPYGKITYEQMIRGVKASMDDDIEFIDGKAETLHKPWPSAKFRAKNLVIVVEESLGAHFVASLGGNPVTPNIEKWRTHSWFFDRLYATGIRSARGLEAITSGFPPTPSRAVLKRPLAQSNFFTLAQYLKNAGYSPSFIYGGESHFDNMKGFFLSNGFDRVIDQNDYTDPEFLGSWGVSDEDLFKRSVDFLKNHTDKPQFVLIFTSSNHPPYEYPDNKITQFSEKKATALNAAKYADYALGKFLDDITAEGIADHSTILVVADHEDKVFGDLPVPIEKFHIPGFIIDSNITSFIDRRLVSQLDLAPTLISLLGIDLPHPMIGHDLTKMTERYRGRVISQFGDNQAYMTEECTVYLQPEQKPLLDCRDSTASDKDAIINTAISHAQFAEYLYTSGSYRMN